MHADADRRVGALIGDIAGCDRHGREWLQPACRKALVGDVQANAERVPVEQLVGDRRGEEQLLEIHASRPRGTERLIRIMGVTGVEPAIRV